MMVYKGPTSSPAARVRDPLKVSPTFKGPPLSVEVKAGSMLLNTLVCPASAVIVIPKGVIVKSSLT